MEYIYIWDIYIYMGLSDGETTQIPCLQFRRPAAENHLKITTSRLCPFDRASLGKFPSYMGYIAL